MGLLDDVAQLRTFLYDGVQAGLPPAIWGSSFKTDQVAESLGWKKDRTMRALRELLESGFLDVEQYGGISGSGFMEPDLFLLNNAGIKAHEARGTPAPSKDEKMGVHDDMLQLHKMLYEWEFARRGKPDSQGEFTSDSVAQSLHWDPDRLNCAIDLLDKEGWLDMNEAGGSHPYVTHSFQLNATGLHEWEMRADVYAARASKASQGTKEEQMEPKPDPKKVFVIHGRHDEARAELGHFLISLGLEPIWFWDLRQKLPGMTHIIDVVDHGMKIAQGVIALFVPEEYACLHPQLRGVGETGENIERWQARPNVLFEAGIAYHRDPARVVFVTLGNAKLFSDVGGMHILTPTKDYGPKSHRLQLRGLLGGGMGCRINESSHDWMTSGDFESAMKALPEVGTRSPFDKSKPAESAQEPPNSEFVVSDGLPMTWNARNVMRALISEFEKARFPLAKDWIIESLKHEVSVKFELQAVGLLDVLPDGTCRLTEKGRDAILLNRDASASVAHATVPSQPKEIEPTRANTSPVAGFSAEAQAILYQIARQYTEAGFPPIKNLVWPEYRGVEHKRATQELDARGFVYRFPSGEIRFTEKGRDWAMNTPTADEEEGEINPNPPQTFMLDNQSGGTPHKPYKNLK